MCRLITFAALLILLAVSSRALADGKAFTGVDRSSMFVGRSNRQHAWISCDGSRQRMIIAIGLDWREGESTGLWLVPIKGRAAEAKIGRLRDVPRPAGRDARQMLSDRIASCGGAVLLTQLWPTCPGSLLLPSLSRSRGGITPHAVLDEDGIRTELLDAPTVEALADHLRDAGVTLPPGGLDSFSPYFDGQHCFVATWITDAAKGFAAGGQPAMLVEFPSTEPWYPMRATSGYGDELFFISVFVDGLVEPAPDSDAAKDADVTHYRAQRNPDNANNVEAWLGRDPQQWDYTAVSFAARATTFTSDFTFRPVHVRGWATSTTIDDWLRQAKWRPWVVGVPLVALVLMLCGAVAGVVARCGVAFGALVGLTGLLTLLTTYYVTRDMRGEAFDRLRKHHKRFMWTYTITATTIGAGALWIGEVITRL